MKPSNLNKIEKQHKYILMLKWIMVITALILFFTSGANLVNKNAIYFLRSVLLVYIISELNFLKYDPAKKAISQLKELIK